MLVPTPKNVTNLLNCIIASSPERQVFIVEEAINRGRRKRGPYLNRTVSKLLHRIIASSPLKTKRYERKTINRGRRKRSPYTNRTVVILLNCISWSLPPTVLLRRHHPQRRMLSHGMPLSYH